jgi:hypothetical protein
MERGPEPQEKSEPQRNDRRGLGEGDGQRGDAQNEIDPRGEVREPKADEEDSDIVKNAPK